MDQGYAELKLRELGIELPRASSPAAKYANCVIVNELMFVSGKGPTSARREAGRDVHDRGRLLRSDL
jgi:enamine deaminase RidA (YjgF/YER057c/UK114 family)